MFEAYGKFELLTCIGRGGMAEVFLARQKGEGRFERLVVIKRILPQFADDERFIDLFLEEARIAALLDHPNVVPIYDLGRVEDSYFIAMPFIHGLTVQSMMRETMSLGLPIPFGISCEIVRQALAGLHYAHERVGLTGEPMMLVHRDVSPTNLMINEQGRALLLDFGIASVADSASEEETGSLRGKLSYMSPEQVEAATLDRRSDIFSLGIVLYELLVGKRLFQCKSDAQVIDAITKDPLPDPAKERPDLPPRAGAVLLKALERRRERRFATAAEMSGALERAIEPAGQQELRRFLHEHFSELLSSQQIRVQRAGAGLLTDERPTRVDRPPSTRHERPRPESSESRPRRWPVLVLGALFLLTCVGVGGWWLLWGPGSRPGGEPLRFGVVPFLPEDLLRREWQPLLEYLEKRTDRRIELVVTLSYRQMMEKLLAGQVDVADLSAYPYLLARRKDPGIQALVVGINNDQTTYQGFIVVRRGSSAHDLVDLRRKRVCYVDRTSTSGYLMPRAMVRKAGFDPRTFFASFQFSGDHYRALRDLLAERCDVACVGSTPFKTSPRRGIPTDDLRVIATSPPLPHGVYVASSRIPEDLARGLREALLELDIEREFGRDRVGTHLQITAFAPVDKKAFEDMDREVARTLVRPDAGAPPDD
jgi:phosphate/phosphite/phosphonate ABC transporter binding protein